LATPNQSIVLRNGTENEQRDSFQMTTDTNGRAAIPPQNTDFRLVAFGPMGYAEIDRDALEKSSNRVTLQPWASIDGTLMLGNHAAAKGLTIMAEPDAFDEVRFKPGAINVQHQIEAKTDAQGKFHFDRIPSGSVMISRQIFVPTGGGGGLSDRCQAQMLDLAPGQSIKVTIGGQGRAVVGRIELPSALRSRRDWSFGPFCKIAQKVSFPDAPEPASLKGASAEQLAAWRAQFAKTDAGKQYALDVRAAREKIALTSYPLEIKSDGSFRVEDVAAGTYELQVIIVRNNTGNLFGGQPIGYASTTLTVPAMSTGRDDSPLELPVIAVHEPSASTKP
jgi:hypothetical protein